MTAHIPVALARRTLSAGGMWVFGSAASAPMVVLVGGIVATYATTQVTSLPLLFLIIGGVVAMLMVGYTAMSREVPHAAAYYAILARGLGREMGVAAGAVALVSYNAIQISLYGLLGATLSGLIGGTWWAWAGLALVLVGVFGVRAIAVSTRLLATILLLSLLVVVIVFSVSGLIDPAGGSLSWEGFSPSGLTTSGVGGAMALCLAALMGVDAPASFSEEADDQQAVTRAVFAGVLTLAVVYSLAAWVMGVSVGTDQVAAAAADPAAGLPFSVMERTIGGFMTPVVQTILIFAIITSMLAFHNVVARYAFAMAREGVLPVALARTGSGIRVSAPVGGSILQTVIALLVVTAFAVAGADPVARMFTWLSTLGAMGLLSLLLLSSVAAMAYFSRMGAGRPSLLTTLFAPLAGVLLGAIVLGAMLINVDSLLGTEPGSWSPYLLPLTLTAATVTGLAWAAHLRRTRREVYQGISEGRPNVHEVPDDVRVTF